jgi:hypothetical protein
LRSLFSDYSSGAISPVFVPSVDHDHHLHISEDPCVNARDVELGLHFNGR